MENIIVGTNKALMLEGVADSDGELTVTMVIDSQYPSADTWLNEDDAKKIIKHLQDAFDL